MTEPAPPPPRNGHLEVRVPLLGEFRATGPLVMAVAVCCGFGLGIIGMQLYTFRSFERELTANITLIRAEVARYCGDRGDR